MTVMVEIVTAEAVTETGGPSGAAVIWYNYTYCTHEMIMILTIFQSVCGALVRGGRPRTHNSVCSEHDGVRGSLE